MPRSAYTLVLDDDYVADLERLAGEAGVAPNEILPALTGDISRRNVRSGITVATAEGHEQVITGGSRDFGD
jgi:hypothetical protein